MLVLRVVTSSVGIAKGVSFDIMQAKLPETTHSIHLQTLVFLYLSEFLKKCSQSVIFDILATAMAWPNQAVF